MLSMPEAFLMLRLDSPSNTSPTVISKSGNVEAGGERVEVVGGGVWVGEHRAEELVK